MEPVDPSNIDIVEQLIARLKSDYSSGQRSAAEELGQIGDARAVWPLIAVLEDGVNVSGAVRREAATALGEIGDFRAIEPLIAALKDGRVNRAAAGALGKIGDTRAIEPLTVALKDAARDMRQASAGALGEIGDARAVEPLIATLKDSDSNVRKTAIGGLGQIGDTRAVEPLIAALNDNDSNVREAAAGALGKIGTHAVEPLITLLKGTNSEVCKAAIEALDEIGWRPGKDENGSIYWVTKRRWDKCIETGGPAVEILIDTLKNSDSSVREAVIGALGDIGDARAVEPLIAALKDSDSNVRKAAIGGLGKIGDTRAVKPLLATLSDSDSTTLDLATEVLTRFGPEAIVPMVEQMQSSPSVSQRRKIAEILIKLERLQSIKAELPRLILDLVELNPGDAYDHSMKLMAATVGMDESLLILAGQALSYRLKSVDTSPASNPKYSQEYMRYEGGVTAVRSLCERKDDIWASSILFRVSRKKSVEVTSSVICEGVSKMTLSFAEERELAKAELMQRGFGDTDPLTLVRV